MPTFRAGLQNFARDGDGGESKHPLEAVLEWMNNHWQDWAMIREQATVASDTLARDDDRSYKPRNVGLSGR